MRRRVCVLVLVLAWSAGGAGQSPPAPVRPDERVVLFNSAGWRDDSGAGWHIPVHGWIYEPQNSRWRKAAVEKLLESAYELTVTPATRPNFDRRINALLADNEGGKRLAIDIGGVHVTLQPSAPNGHFQGTVRLGPDTALRNATGGLLHYRVLLPEGDTRSFPGAAKLIPPRGVSVISDIDDTIKHTQVRDRHAMLDRSLLQDFEAVQGMPELYRAWSARGVAFHYVSSSPWHFYPSLLDFTRKAGFPWATFSLKLVRIKDETLFDLFKPGTQTKPAQIEPLLDRFPGRHFVLIGDNGEQDPEVYAQIMRRHPAQVLRIYLRNVAGESREDLRYQSAYQGIDRARWRLFDDPATLELPAP